MKLTDVTRSARFVTLVDGLKNLFNFSANPRSHRGITFRAGHLIMGKLFNTKSEKEALKIAKETKSDFGHGIEMRPLIQILGEELVKAADKCLPDEIRTLAVEWQHSTANRQTGITKYVFEHFISNSQVELAGEELNWQSAHKNLWHDFEANSYDNAKILPKQYGAWNKDTCIANCQGKTQMLTAFARLAHAEVMVVSPIVSARSVVDVTRNSIVKMITDDICERGIKYPDASFKESLDAYYYVEDFHSWTLGESFHVCVAIRLCNGQWVVIDPHSLNWGVFPETWNLEQTFRLLKKYREVLPGLQITVHDNGLHQKILDEGINKVRELLARSKKLEEMIGESVDPMSVAKTLVNSGEIDFILRGYGRDDIVSVPGVPREMKEYVAVTIYLHGDPLDGSLLFGAMSDEHFLEKKLGSLLTVYHHFAIEGMKDQLNMGGVLLHPVCEFGLPEYHIAMSALNSLCERGNGSENRFFLDYAFDQVTLYNALSEKFVRFRPADPEVAVAAAEVLKALPFIHSRTKGKL